MKRFNDKKVTINVKEIKERKFDIIDQKLKKASKDKMNKQIRPCSSAG